MYVTDQWLSLDLDAVKGAYNDSIIPSTESRRTK